MTKLAPRIVADWLSSSQTVALMEMFAQAGYTARFVGGVVRNALLGEPVNDFDVATDARPKRVMELARIVGFKAIPTGIDHGTVTVVIDKTVYEITTLRTDVETDGRHARVAFTRDWREDAARRDFTMNALYAGANGEVFDPLGGYGDLMARKVRFIGNPSDRIVEDYLRILRFFRFSAQYGEGKVDEAGLLACVRLHQGLQHLSPERIRVEFLRLLQMENASRVLGVMFDHGLLLPLTGRVPHLARFRRWVRLEACLERPASEIHRLGALSMLVPEDAGHLAKRLRLSNKEKRLLLLWPRNEAFTAFLSKQQARRLFYHLGDAFQISVAISWLKSGAPLEDEKWRMIYKLPELWQRPEFPLTGQDLLDRGLAPGPSIGKKLAQLKKIWLEGDFQPGKEELLSHINPEKL